MFIRLYKECYSGIDLGIDGSIIEYFLFSLLLFPLLSANSTEMATAIGWTEIGIGSFAGVLICLGNLFISIGVADGLAGPA